MQVNSTFRGIPDNIGVGQIVAGFYNRADAIHSYFFYSLAISIIILLFLALRGLKKKRKRVSLLAIVVAIILIGLLFADYLFPIYFYNAIFAVIAR